MKFNVLVADPPFSFSDRLTMDDVKRGAESNYDVLSIQDIKNLPIKDISADDALLALWCPSSLLLEGLQIMEAWGFRQTQTHIWVKIKLNPLGMEKKFDFKTFSLDSALGFFMGRIFRQTHEVCLIGVKGKIYSHLKNKSQRSVHFAPNLKHSAKPEKLQDMLDLMFPDLTKIEIFARRQRKGYVCIGNESPASLGKDIRIILNDISTRQDIDQTTIW